MCCILKDKGKKKKKKADFGVVTSSLFFKMWLIFLWNDLNRKKKCGNLKKKSQRGKKSRGHEEKVRDQKLRRGRRIRAQQGERRGCH